MIAKPIRILLVEDNEGDILLTTEALRDSKVTNEILVARDGQEAHEMLLNAIAEASPLPDIILLDINLPRMSGHEFLEAVKNNDQLKHIPVVMLTTSSADFDIKRAYSNHVNCYITKPVELTDFFNVVAGIDDFWFSIVQLPPRD
jgi:CheY-like chemotaxis protein